MASDKLAAAIRAHYESLPRLETTVPEWDNVTLYAKPLTLSDQAKIDTWRGIQSDRYLVFARILILKAEDEAGNRVFSDADLGMLKDGSMGDIVSKAARELTAPPNVAEKLDQEKNDLGEVSG
ncbi:hypothetical protein K0U83_13025 [bacterium]|nr:hypothetical protein [bacterium]